LHSADQGGDAPRRLAQGSVLFRRVQPASSNAKTVSQCPCGCSRACPRFHARSRPSASVFDRPQIEWHKSAASRGSIPGRHLFGTPDDIILERLCDFIGTRVDDRGGVDAAGGGVRRIIR
jgi:hypothetical protein